MKRAVVASGSRVLSYTRTARATSPTKSPIEFRVYDDSRGGNPGVRSVAMKLRMERQGNRRVTVASRWTLRQSVF
jgi:hypothetical protein